MQTFFYLDFFRVQLMNEISFVQLRKQEITDLHSFATQKQLIDAQFLHGSRYNLFFY